MNVLTDSFRREIDYLRISVIDRCNLRCIYCMPSEGITPSRHADILRYEEIIRIVKVAAGLGVRKIRLTGGEPLTRKNISFLIREIKKINGIEDLSMTTNGLLLERFAQEIADSGLDRVNISIDSFNPEKYREITRGGDIGKVLSGLAAAEKAGFYPIKINMVPVRGMNQDEIKDFALITLSSDYHVRFIECMPTGSIDFWSPDKYITTDEMMGIIGSIGPLIPVRMRKHGPSKYYRFEGAKGVIGFISALTHHFCQDCNRLRLTADGKLRPCLFSETEIDLKSAIRSGAPDSEIERLLRLSIEVKPEGHTLGSRKPPEALASETGSCRTTNLKRPMSGIGG